MKDPEQELAELLARRAEVKAEITEKTKRLRDVERKRREAINRRIRRAKYRVSSADRKRRTRRLILIGALMERRMQADPQVAERMLAALDADLDRDQDRELFDLAPLEGKA